MYTNSSADSMFSNEWQISAYQYDWDSINVDQQKYDGYFTYDGMMIKVYGIITDYQEIRHILYNRIENSNPDNPDDYLEKVGKYLNDHGIGFRVFRDDFILLSMESNSLVLSEYDKKYFRKTYPVMNPSRYFVSFSTSQYRTMNKNSNWLIGS